MLQTIYRKASPKMQSKIISIQDISKYEYFMAYSLEMQNTKSDFAQNIIIATTLDALCNFQKNYQNGL